MFYSSSSPDSLFLSMAVSPKEQEKAEDFGITLKLDICGLYKVHISYGFGAYAQQHNQYVTYSMIVWIYAFR